MDLTYSNRCKENVNDLEEAIGLRKEAASLLGFENHAAFKVNLLFILKFFLTSSSSFFALFPFECKIDFFLFLFTYATRIHFLPFNHFCLA